jgi:hypothetical protein
MKIITDDGNEYGIEHVKITDIGMDDVVIVRIKGRLGLSEINNAKETIERVFGADVPCLVLDDNADIEIAKKEQLDEPQS